jgi:hypothetical protein
LIQSFNVIDAVAAYCKVEESKILKREKSRRFKIVIIKQEEDTRSLQKMELKAAMLLVLKEKRSKICFLCLRNEELQFEKRTYSFNTSGDLSKHFNKKHFLNVKGRDRIKCNVCKIPLEHKMHLQRHAFEIHGTVSKVSKCLYLVIQTAPNVGSVASRAIPFSPQPKIAACA